MSFLSRLLKRKPVKDATVTLVGPPKAGKTTLVYYLETGEPVHKELHTTLGLEIRSKAFKLAGWKIRAIDTGGQKIYQQMFWEIAIQQADAVLFVLDAVARTLNPEVHELMLEQFNYVLDIVPEDTPLLILLNKQDLKEHHPLSPQEAIALFDPSLFEGRTIGFMPISAKYGDGVTEAMEWLIDHLSKK